MKNFLTQLVLFLFFLCLISEIMIRFFRLVPDIPERFIDQYGIQRYKQGQSGYYTKAKSKWTVNTFGWLGVSDIEKDPIISIIGDSYIENIMNPIACNQGSLLKSLLPEYSFFEAGRSGITFIEAMEISRILDIEIHPQYQLLYLSEQDFYESVAEIKKYSDRLQVSLSTQELLPNQLKSPRLKKILYNIKLLYYLYLRFPIFVKKQNKGEIAQNVSTKGKYDDSIVKELFAYCSKNYALNKLIFVFHPNTDQRIMTLAHEYGIKTILLDSSEDTMWSLGTHEGHWSCYGHNQISKQVKSQLGEILSK